MKGTTQNKNKLDKMQHSNVTECKIQNKTESNEVQHTNVSQRVQRRIKAEFNEM